MRDPADALDREVPTRAVWVSFDLIGRDCLVAAAEAGASIVGIVTLPVSVNGARAGQCSFEEVAQELGAALIVAQDINDPACLDSIGRLSPDMLFVVGWSQLVGKSLISIAPRGVFGMHPTLLPKHRGRAPIPWTILAGLTKTGVTMFEIVDETADTGLLVGQLEVPVLADDTATSLFERIRHAHVDLIEQLMPGLLQGTAPRIPQDERRSSWWPKRTPLDCIIDWNARATHVHDWIRAQTHPYPGAFTYLEEQKVVIWRASVQPGVESGVPGQVLSEHPEGTIVGCGHGALLMEEVEIGGRVFTATGIGRVLPVGAVLG